MTTTQSDTERAGEAWTPGEWRVEPASPHVHGPYVVDVDGRSICDPYYLSEMDEPVIHRPAYAAANASLIAAAPDLYAALKKLLDVLSEDSPHTYVIRDGYAALEKARGK